MSTSSARERLARQITGSVYDGFSEIVRAFIGWGLPYLIGRVYFNDLESLQELAVGIFIGGLIYIPFCWFEVRFSPQLHKWVYGFRQHSFIQNVRDGGYRPMVFMQHGLMVGMWMGAKAPDRVNKLILSNTTAYFENKQIWNDRLAVVKEKGLSAIVQGTLERWFTKAFRDREPGKVKAIGDMFLATKAEGYMGCGAAVRNMDHRPLLPKRDARPSSAIAQAAATAAQRPEEQLRPSDTGVFSMKDVPSFDGSLCSG